MVRPGIALLALILAGVFATTAYSIKAPPHHRFPHHDNYHTLEAANYGKDRHPSALGPPWIVRGRDHCEHHTRSCNHDDTHCNDHIAPGAPHHRRPVCEQEHVNECCANHTDSGASWCEHHVNSGTPWCEKHVNETINKTGVSQTGKSDVQRKSSTAGDDGREVQQEEKRGHRARRGAGWEGRR
ncbi:hypothetical protein [Pyrolobus fumarii]|uniref:hypothetical protein n=1 Tax=Pyrolobus fumarii TaxID=54252 RepID=UPI00064E39B1|nr:hypothetical protein [Pyrolobus fumarii]